MGKEDEVSKGRSANEGVYLSTVTSTVRIAPLYQQSQNTYESLENFNTYPEFSTY